MFLQGMLRSELKVEKGRRKTHSNILCVNCSGVCWLNCHIGRTLSASFGTVLKPDKVFYRKHAGRYLASVLRRCCYVGRVFCGGCWMLRCCFPSFVFRTSVLFGYHLGVCICVCFLLCCLGFSSVYMHVLAKPLGKIMSTNPFNPV